MSLCRVVVVVFVPLRAHVVTISLSSLCGDPGPPGVRRMCATRKSRQQPAKWGVRECEGADGYGSVEGDFIYRRVCALFACSSAGYLFGLVFCCVCVFLCVYVEYALMKPFRVCARLLL